MPETYQVIDADAFLAAWREFKTTTSAPAQRVHTVVANDDFDLPDGVARAFYVSVAGPLRFQDGAGNVVTLQSRGAQYHAITMKRLLATGTDVPAGSVLAIY